METFGPTPRELGGEDSKSSDPASVDDRTKLAEGAPGAAPNLLGPPTANRRRLQNERSAITHHFAFGGHEGYLTVGFYPNGQPGEIFIRMAKAGSTIAGLMECFGTVVSVSLLRPGEPPLQSAHQAGLRSSPILDTPPRPAIQKRFEIAPRALTRNDVSIRYRRRMLIRHQPAKTTSLRFAQFRNSTGVR